MTSTYKLKLPPHSSSQFSKIDYMLFEYSVNINLSIRSTVVICQNTSIKRGHSDFHFQRQCSNRHQIYPLAWNHQNKQTNKQKTKIPLKAYETVFKTMDDNERPEFLGDQRQMRKALWFPMITDVRELPGHSEWRESPDKAWQLRVKETELRIWGNQGS